MVNIPRQVRFFRGLFFHSFYYVKGPPKKRHDLTKDLIDRTKRARVRGPFCMYAWAIVHTMSFWQTRRTPTLPYNPLHAQDAPQQEPRSATAAHSSVAVVFHAAPRQEPRSATAPHCQPDTTFNGSSCRWITCGQLGENPPRTLVKFHTSGSYPHFIHRLSTGYPQLIHNSKPPTACEVC